jgi:hypothetical protein
MRAGQAFELPVTLGELKEPKGRTAQPRVPDESP